MLTFRTVLFALVFTGLFACQSSNNRFDIDISDVNIAPVKIKQYGQALFEMDKSDIPNELKRLKPEFPVFLEADLNNPENIERIRNFVEDTFLVRVYNDTRAVYPDLSMLEKDITRAFAYYYHYYPEENPPQVFTYISAFDYEHRIQRYQTNVLIALDMYLGEDYPDYQQLGVPRYILRKFQPDYIVRDIMNEFAKRKTNFRTVGNKLLEQMLYEGKILWFINAMIPDIKKEVLFDYTNQQLQWTQQNERMAWAFMIENEMLYKSDPTVNQKFIKESPFTSYFSKDSPPRLGWWIGYQIINQYMINNPDVSLETMLQNIDATAILKDSKYKPE